MKRDNKILYEKIMRHVAREVKRALNELDYYVDNVDYTVTKSYDLPNYDNVKNIKNTLLTQVEPTKKDKVRLLQWSKDSETPRMNRVVKQAILGITDINKLVRRWAMAVMLNMTLSRFFDALEKRVIDKTYFSEKEVNIARAYWERIGQEKYPEYWS